MQIPVNKNIDTYKDDFFRGLTLHQTLTSVVTIIAAAGSFTFFTYVAHVPSSLSICCTLPFALSVAAAGFLKKHGMGLAEWIQKKQKVTHAPLLVYQPYLAAVPLVSGTGKTKKDNGRILLVTDEGQYARSKQYNLPGLATKEAGLIEKNHEGI